MVKVIGEPEFRRSMRRPLATPHEASREPPADTRQPSLVQPVSAALIAAKSGGHANLVTTHPQGCEQKLGDPAISRRNRMIRRLQRRVKGDTHSISATRRPISIAPHRASESVFLW